MTARRHHYISQCYLKGFAVQRRKGAPQIHVFDRENQKTFQTSTDNVGLKRDFNRIDAKDTDPDVVEKMLAEFEGQAAPALERTIQAEAFQTDDDRTIILNLLALFALRNPRLRENIRDFHERVMKQVLGVTLQNKDRWEEQEKQMIEAGYVSKSKVPYEELRAFYEADEYDIKLDTGYHVAMELKTFDALLPHLFRRGWMIMKADETSGGFVTSDHPVTLMWSDPKMRNGFYPPGFGLEGTQVIFPLSSRLALAGAYGLRNEDIALPEEHVAAVNGATILGAERQVYSRDLHFRYVVNNESGVRKAARLIDDSFFKPAQPKITKRTLRSI